MGFKIQDQSSPQVKLTQEIVVMRRKQQKEAEAAEAAEAAAAAAQLDVLLQRERRTQSLEAGLSSAVHTHAHATCTCHMHTYAHPIARGRA